MKCFKCSGNKKESILSAALKLFVEQGEQSTSMKWIAQEAKCGIGTMYNYFLSKDELINELFIVIKTKLLTVIIGSFNTDTPLKQKFINTWVKTIDFAISNPLEYAFLDIFAHSPRISTEASEKVNNLIYPILEIYEKGKKEGIIKNEDTIQLLIFTNGAISASILRNPNINEQEKKAIATMAWDAIKS